MTDQTKLPVSRDEVFKQASQFLDVEASVPSLTSIRALFETPTSPSIAVYFAEWRNINADKIAQIRRTPAQLKNYCERLQGELAEISTRYKAAVRDDNHFKQWVKDTYPYILTEWNDYEIGEETWDN